MIDTMKPYPEYKDSGLPWAARVPAHWKIRRSKNLFRCVDVRSKTGTEERLTVSSERGVVPRSSMKITMFEAKSYIGHKLCWPGDIVINSLWAWSCGLGVARHHGLISSAYGVYRLLPDFEEYATFIHHLLRSKAYHWELRTRSKGVWTSRLQLTDDAFLRSPVLVPPQDEAKAISRFIFEMDRKVNRFIRNRRRLIEVLNEQKHTIINRAVTRGLDPDVPLKPSGIDWIGDIPEHWEARRLQTVAELRVSNVDKHTKEGEFPVRLCNYTDVYKNTVIAEDMPFMAATATREEIDAFRLHVGDVIITKDSEDWRDIGVPAFVAETADDLVCGYHLAILRPRPKVAVGRFLAYALQCRGVVTQLSLAATGVTRYGLSHGAIKTITLPAPPIDEQGPIAQHIDEETASLNEATARAKREIDLIREYRTRLIADVVTGKVDVRHLALVDSLPADEKIDETIDAEDMIDDDEPAMVADDGKDD